jgi:hypothetical protein
MQNVSDVPGGGYTRRRSSEPYELKVFYRRFVQVFESGRAVGFSQNLESTQSTGTGTRYPVRSFLPFNKWQQVASSHVQWQQRPPSGIQWRRWQQVSVRPHFGLRLDRPNCGLRLDRPELLLYSKNCGLQKRHKKDTKKSQKSHKKVFT